jgi:hypothetical protein
MWKPIGVISLWLALIALPHLGSSAVPVSPSGVQVAATVPLEPGDPFLDGAEARKDVESPASEATIHFKNGIDKGLTLVEAALVLDGDPLEAVSDLSPQGDNVVFSGRLSPGPHVVTTHLTVLGKRRGGIFTYMTDFKWNVTTEHTLTVLPRRKMAFTVSAVRKKGMNVPLDKQVEVTVYNELLPEPTSAL